MSGSAKGSGQTAKLEDHEKPTDEEQAQKDQQQQQQQQQQKQQPTLLEEDDEFEDFPVEGTHILHICPLLFMSYASLDWSGPANHAVR